MRPNLVIGLTGGIGTGKSAVANLFAARGVPVIDADVLAREVVMPGEPALDEIVRAFGSAILTASGELDRRRMREQVFSDAHGRERLEAIIHPRVYAEIERRLESVTYPYAIVVVPLLVETGGVERVDRVLVVDAPTQMQIARVSRRDGTTPSAVEKILAAQLDRRARNAAADDIIENDGSQADLERKVDALHAQYLASAQRVASERPEVKE